MATLGELLWATYFLTNMHDTYIQSESELPKKIGEEIDFLADHLIDYDEKPYRFGGWREEGIANIQTHIRTTLIKQFQAYVEELEGEYVDEENIDLPDDMKFGTGRVRDFRVGKNTGLRVAIDKANNFIKYLEQKRP